MPSHVQQRNLRIFGWCRRDKPHKPLRLSRLNHPNITKFLCILCFSKFLKNALHFHCTTICFNSKMVDVFSWNTCTYQFILPQQWTMSRSAVWPCSNMPILDSLASICKALMIQWQHRIGMPPVQSRREIESCVWWSTTSGSESVHTLKPQNHTHETQDLRN